MIDKILQVASSQLPLKITFICWDGNTLTISGDSWSFSTLSAWRVVRGKKISFGCWDSDINEKVDALKGCSLLKIVRQGISVGVDPVFMLSGDSMLEIFSTDTVEPWVLKLPNGEIFTGALGA